jgi:hypothetical protein
MRICKALIVAGAAIGFVPVVPTLAAEPPKSELSIADNDGIFVDGRSFKIVAGHTNGEASAMVRKSGARELGPAAILFRRGNKLYLATTLPNARRDYGGSENRDYGGSENRDYGGSENRDYGGSENRDYGGAAQSRQANQRQSNNRRDYGGSENRDYGGSENRDYGGSENRDYGGSENRDYGGSENRDYGRGPGTAQSRQAIQPRSPEGAYDPDYAQYRLRKFFDENWTATELK